MPANTELADFLRNRRARIKPDDVGVRSFGARRVPGLRREELAQLAGVSPTYYTRLEQGQSGNASEAVLDAVARALALDEDERAHLHDLARPRPARRRRPSRPDMARKGTRQLIDALGPVPAVVLGRRNEVLAWNALGHVLLAGHHDRDAPDRPADRPNLTRMLFLDPHTRDLYRHWDEEAARAVASLRLMAGRSADDRELAELIGELSMKSPEFGALWSRHPVRDCTTGTKHFRHPEVGVLDLQFEALHLPDEPGRRVLMYSAEPGSPAEAALLLLGRLSLAGGRADGSTTPPAGPGHRLTRTL
ncbi:helix-turn-helix transcriptional regulator [Sphaerisporangium corydalis]|uniref:Helix-turn-helix transcriptional regulator n=1 Tax=Sphaerisporangium corydalis TaxID=1441875 RepID=A0ABV9E9Q4_9ACTN|nr:helix-turn-helix transcriptional regulator [Sphaerisporangium corydalis]